jgi:FkbM family methyltransferase
MYVAGVSLINLMKLFLKIIFKEFYHLFRTKNSREFLRLSALYGDTPRYQLRTVDFLEYHIQVPDCFSFLWQFKEIFVDEAYRFQTASPAPLIYDCGANIGTSILYFKQLFPEARIIAFEADPQIARMLQENLLTNAIDQVELIDKAVWVNNDGIEIGLEGADGASVYGKANKVLIPSVRLREYLQREKYIDMLKIDIEGAETAVLQDCQEVLGHVQHLFIEYHAYQDEPQKLDNILAILRKSGFRYFIRDDQDRKSPFVLRQYKGNTGMDLQLNIFAYRNTSLIN